MLSLSGINASVDTNSLSPCKLHDFAIIESPASRIRGSLGSWKNIIKRGRLQHTEQLVRAAGHVHRNLHGKARNSIASEGGTAAGSGPSADAGNTYGRPDSLQSTPAPLWTFFQDQFLPIVLLSAVSAGYAFPEPGKAAHALGLSKLVTSTIFIVSGLTLRSEEVLKAAAAWPVWTYGLVSILLLTPLAAIGVLRLPLQPPEFAAGLAVFCCVPTTLTSGVTLSQAAGANSALALALTVGTNVLGILTMPYMLAGLFAQGSTVRLPPGPLLHTLLTTVLLPLTAGAAVRATIPGMAAVISKYRKALSMLNNSLLGLVPWMQVSCSKSALASVAPSSLCLVVAAGIGVHVMYLAINTVVTRVLLPVRTSGETEAKGVRRAVVLVASQKTLPVAAAVVERLGGALGETGLLVLPCIAAHLCQILLDSALVSIWLKQDVAARTKEAGA